MRAAVSIAIAVGFGACLVAGAWRSTGTVHELRRPADSVANVRPTVLPAVWVFVRHGCARCTTHLEALGVACRALGPEESARLERRLRIIGACTRARRDSHLLPDSAAAPCTRIVPTTWIWNADGEVERVWRGARGVHAWTALLREITTREPA
jgi:hypothetical protein